MGKGLVISAAGALAAGALVAVPLLVGGAAAEEPVVEPVVVGAPAKVPVEHYVAFGDSFVSGPGIQPQRMGPCHQSENNFPSLIAAELDATESFTDMSCGGATTEHLTAAQVLVGGANPPQLDALTDDTSLITFGTLGGNDMGLVGMATSCVFGECGPDTPGDVAALAGIEEARAHMVSGLRAAKKTSPDAEIYVIGYSTYLLDGGCAAAAVLGITADEADYLQGRIDSLSDMLADIAEQERVEFVDMRQIPGVDEHTACAEPEKQWIRALNTYGDGSVFHPSSCGMDASAQHLLNAIRAHRGEAQHPFDDSCVSAGPDVPTPPFSR